MNTDVLVFEVRSRVVDSCLAEFYPSTFSDDHAQILRVTVVCLGVKEDLPGTGATLRPLDEHFHRDRLVDAVDGFDGGQVHSRLLLTSAISRSDPNSLC